MKRKILIGSFAAGGLALVLGAAILGSSAARSRWSELRSVAELREQFNQDQGSTRIVLLLSPT